MNTELQKLEELCLTWLSFRTDIKKLENLEVLIHYNSSVAEHTAEFYNSVTIEQYCKWRDCANDYKDYDTTNSVNEWFVTATMMKELKEGKNPKKVLNKLIKIIRPPVENIAY